MKTGKLLCILKQSWDLYQCSSSIIKTCTVAELTHFLMRIRTRMLVVISGDNKLILQSHEWSGLIVSSGEQFDLFCLKGHAYDISFIERRYEQPTLSCEITSVFCENEFLDFRICMTCERNDICLSRLWHCRRGSSLAGPPTPNFVTHIFFAPLRYVGKILLDISYENPGFAPTLKLKY